MATRTHITEIQAHKVRTGQSLDGLAKANGLTWQVLANFNWGTADPNKISQHLRKDVGCTKKTQDRKNYVFDDSDEPGIIYIPKPWRVGSLPTNKTHVVRVRIFKPDERPFIWSV